jgi:hypothetical protein
MFCFDLSLQGPIFSAAKKIGFVQDLKWSHNNELRNKKQTKNGKRRKTAEMKLEAMSVFCQVQQH